jgi:hypothetical protein
MAAEQPVLLVELERDLAAPVDGWAAELSRRGVVVVADDLGRQAIDRSSARAIYAEHREQQEAAARKRAEIERQAVAADEARRAALPKGIPVDAVPTGVSAAELMMLSDPFPVKRRQSVLEHALENPGGATVFTPISEDAS